MGRHDFQFGPQDLSRTEHADAASPAREFVPDRSGLCCVASSPAVSFQTRSRRCRCFATCRHQLATIAYQQPELQNNKARKPRWDGRVQSEPFISRRSVSYSRQPCNHKMRGGACPLCHGKIPFVLPKHQHAGKFQQATRQAVVEQLELLSLLQV